MASDVMDMSDDLRRLLLMINFAILNAIFSLFGIGSNVINLCVFWKQGFSENINISLFVLAIADLCELLLGVVYSLLYNPVFLGANLPIRPLDFINVVIAFPRQALSHIKSSITAFIAFERCMCVVLPLKVKVIITPGTTAAVLVIIISSLALTLVPFYLSIYLNFGLDPTTNRTILSAQYAHPESPADLNPLLSTHTAVQVGSYIAVSLFTAVLAIKLRQQSRFRQKNATLSKTATRENNRKSTRTIALVLTMTATYIVCYSPGILLLLIGFIEPRFGVFGSLMNYFLVLVSLNIMFESINSSITIFLYFSMSVNYRNTFFGLFRWNVSK